WLMINLMTTWKLVKVVIFVVLAVSVWMALFNMTTYLSAGVSARNRFTAIGSGAGWSLIASRLYVGLVLCIWAAQLVHTQPILRLALYGATIPLTIAMLLTGARAPLAASIISICLFLLLRLNYEWRSVRSGVLIALPMVAVI